MPELPEVETIRRGLTSKIIGQTILSVEVRSPKLFVGNPDALIGRKFVEILRRAKLMIWRLDIGCVAVHLKMSGQVIYQPNHGEAVVGGHPDKAYNQTLPHKHTHVIIKLDKGTIYYNDVRKFGWLKVINDTDELAGITSKYGPEHDSPSFTLDYFTHQLHNKQGTIKQALLDQTLISGLGNIYADETLFCAQVNPQTNCRKLSHQQIKQLFECIPKILQLALEKGGTSAQNYVNADGQVGTYQKIAKVYKRENQPCFNCQTLIKRIKIAGRSSHYCPKCQKI